MRLKPAYLSLFLSFWVLGTVTACKNEATIPENTAQLESDSMRAISHSATVPSEAGLAAGREQYTIEGTGFIVEGEEFQFGDTIKILDLQKRPLSAIVITDEYQVLALKCLAADSLYYKVKREGNIGYVKRQEGKIAFETWEEHILNLFSVGFDYNRNPLKQQPDENSTTLPLVEDEHWHPVKIEGDWLQVRWEYEDTGKRGWIKWRDGNSLLIDFFYFA